MNTELSLNETRKSRTQSVIWESNQLIPVRISVTVQVVEEGNIMSGSVIDDKSESKIRLLNEKEAVEHFNTQVQALLGISAEEFLERRMKGEYQDACDNPKILKLLMMIPKLLAR